MRQQVKSHPAENGSYSNDAKFSSFHAIARFKSDERLRAKKKVISLILIGLLISVLIHLNIGFLLSLLMRGGSNSTSPGAMTTIQFAIENSESLSNMPQGEQLQKQEAVQTEATSESMNATQATLTADTETTSLDSSSQSTAPSLAGGGSAGMGDRMGGSGSGVSFFGISSVGSRFCYIVDSSGSMRSQNRLESAIAELSRSLKQLPDFARFYVLFYSSSITEPSMQKGWNTARSSTIRRMINEFQTIHASGGTIPTAAFEKAFALNPPPEVIFFLTDGEITGFTADILRKMLPPKSRVVVNTIAFGDAAGQQQMIDIAKATGGQYKFVPSRPSP